LPDPDWNQPNRQLVLNLENEIENNDNNQRGKAKRKRHHG
jgi:hypothetical protein